MTDKATAWTTWAANNLLVPVVTGVVISAFALGGADVAFGGLQERVDDNTEAIEEIDIDLDEHKALVGHPIGRDRQASMQRDVDSHEDRVRALERHISAICAATDADCSN